MLSKVGEHDGVSHFSWRPERAPVPAISPEAPASRQEIVDVPGDANRDAAHPARERACAFRLDDEMDVVALHGVVNYAKSVGIPARRACDRATYLGEDELAAERRDVRGKRHVDGLRGSMNRTRAMRRTRPRPRLATGSATRAAPRGWKGQ